MKTGDPNKDLIDPDALGMINILEAEDADIDSMLDFIARYVRKVHTDNNAGTYVPRVYWTK